jgi:hypothetical protein
MIDDNPFKIEVLSIFLRIKRKYNHVGKERMSLFKKAQDRVTVDIEEQLVKKIPQNRDFSCQNERP